MSTKIQKVVVIGAGPTGVLTARLLAQRGITVDLLEAGDVIDQRPRGLAYGPAGVSVLRRAGVLDEIRAKTFEIRDLAWRKLDGEILADVNNVDDPKRVDRMVLMPVHALWSYGQETKRFMGDFVVGCDGASSGVRKGLYGHDFPGFSWDKQLVVLHVRYNIDRFKWSDLQWVIDKEHWGMSCRLGEDNLWRRGYGEVPGLTEQQLRNRLPVKLEKFLPGNPKPNQYEILRFSPFVMRQRCVERMRVGRIMILGDAAHLSNPMGGSGLTGGLADVGSLIDCLYGIHDGKTGLEILDKWDEIRRGIYKNHIDPVSTSNLQRLSQDPDFLVGVDPMLGTLKVARDDPVASEAMFQHEMSIAHDMTKYYADFPVS